MSDRADGDAEVKQDEKVREPQPAAYGGAVLDGLSECVEISGFGNNRGNRLDRVHARPRSLIIEIVCSHFIETKCALSFASPGPGIPT